MKHVYACRSDIWVEFRFIDVDGDCERSTSSEESHDPGRTSSAKALVMAIAIVATAYLI